MTDRLLPLAKSSILEIYQELFTQFGPQHWWPGESPTEVAVGAVLVQNTAWKNVERAIDNLRQADLLQVDKLYQLPVAELETLIQPAGFYRVKAKRLRNLLALIVEQHEGEIERLLGLPMEVARQQLLAVQGVGPETADSILLYGGGHPKFVVDAYTRRVLLRHGWLAPPAKAGPATYATMQQLFEQALPRDVALFNEYHALIVRVGHLHCRRTPQCDGCPLQHRLPPSGPLATG